MARPQAPRGHGRRRVIDAAVELFAEHGVTGTSLQMIADHLGVTKAAVYYQFHAKEDIVLAVLEEALVDLRAFVETAEAEPSPDEAAMVALRGLVDLMIGHRKVVAALMRDPEVERIMATHDDLNSLVGRLTALLLGPAPDLRRRIAVSVVGAGVAQAGTDPLLADVDDETLRAELLELGPSMLPRS
ncbi:TetR/AcrR family transcriptional regulator [Terrabacter aerolatus]|uniref:TetR family transcriptional regulator n=1 Tax=Terrabacter aerolatus TaxID=422442 RepID=A0A512D0Q2_9MICO|nr:TetR/AcrR family transcriptional regulator [Terrabacter aerolatus]GEO30035.1 TetR family transcriptional regulator [Terrabacter aerolatus]